MTRINGQIESLKRIRETLDQKGITWFKTTGQINKFLKTYEYEKELLVFNTERQLEIDLAVLQTKAFFWQKDHENLKTQTESHLTNKVQQVKNHTF